MTYELYNRLYLRALDCHTVDEFLADCGDPDLLDLYEDDTDRLVDALLAIWGVAFDGTRHIRARLCMTRAEFSAAYRIPIRTLENWESKGGDNSRKPPEYIVSALALASGIYPFTVSNAGTAYFCDYCGRRWISPGKPEVCPNCGSYCVIEDTPANARRSAEDLTAYENKLIEQED